MNTITITDSKPERFRIVKGQTVSMPDELNINDFEIDGYLQGGRVNRREPLNIDLFDAIQYISTTSNDQEGTQFIHCIGYRKQENKYTVIILKRK